MALGADYNAILYFELRMSHVITIILTYKQIWILRLTVYYLYRYLISVVLKHKFLQ